MSRDQNFLLWATKGRILRYTKKDKKKKNKTEMELHFPQNNVGVNRHMLTHKHI